jgi:CelD/BcsL family acetyltransferase involved in cellulose biosynthesis
MILRKNIQDYSLTILHSPDAFAIVESEWRALWGKSKDATQFQNWDWQFLYWKHVTPRNLPHIFVLRHLDGSCALLGAFDVVRDKKSGLSKFAFVGDDRADYHALLAEPGLSTEVGAAVLREIVAFALGVGSLAELSNIPSTSWTGQSLERFFATNPQDQKLIERWESNTFAIGLPGTMEEYVEHLGPKIRRDYRNDLRRIQKEYSYDFRLYDKLDSKVDIWLEEIEAIDVARWGDLSKFTNPARRAFEREAMRAMLREGILKVFILYVDGCPVSFVVGASMHGRLLIDQISHRPAVLPKFSIGRLTNLMAVESSIGVGYHLYDLTRGGEAYKQWLGGQPSTNWHARFYRNRLSKLALKWGKVSLDFVRSQKWLAQGYRNYFRCRIS